jgi:thiol-disulfide isomerase/thioredoxin
VVLLDFWASWCIPCRKEMPFLVEFYNANKDKKFVILAVNIDDKAENMNKFLSQLDTRVPFPIIHDAKKEIPPKYDLQAMPTTAFIDKSGNIRYRHTGFKDSYKEDFSKELETLLSESAKGEKK